MPGGLKEGKKIGAQIAFESALAPSMMNNRGTAGSSPRSIRSSMSAWTTAAFSVAPSASVPLLEFHCQSFVLNSLHKLRGKFLWNARDWKGPRLEVGIDPLPAFPREAVNGGIGVSQLDHDVHPMNSRPGSTALIPPA